MNYRDINKKLNEISETHPHLASFWKYYLYLKKISFDEGIKNCLNQLKHINEIDDPSFETLFFFYLFQRSI
jgi:hypothetical protein